MPTPLPAAAIPARSRRALMAALVALGVLYCVWFWPDPQRVAVIVVFVLPPFALALGVWRRRAHAAFWAGVAALAWFAHAVTAAWVQPEARAPAWGALVLAVVIVIAASLPGLHARFARRR